MSDEYTQEQEIKLLEQDYAVLQESLDDLRKQSIATGKNLLQEKIAHTEIELQNISQRLAYLNQLDGSTTSEAAAPLATLYQVPQLPQNIIHPGLFNELKARLVMKATLSEGTAKQKTPLLLQAFSGMGKSLLATALAYDDTVRRTFIDGIFWVSVGQATNILDRQCAVLTAMNPAYDENNVISSEIATTQLQKLCENRSCLFILDDVWDVRDVLVFNALGKNCQLLITTCESTLLELFKHFTPSVQGFSLLPFTEGQAMEFLLRDSQQSVTSVLKPVTQLVKLCEGLPLTLKLLTNIVYTQSSPEWQTLLHRLQQAESDEFPTSYPRTLMQALHLNIQALGEEQAEPYLTLAVFMDYMHIPQATVLMLWRYLYHMSGEQAQVFIGELVEKGLLYKRSNDLSLQVCQHDYLCHQVDLEKLHGHLLAAYRRHCDQHGWVSGPKDGYFFKYLCTHLYLAGRTREVKSLLLDFDWLYMTLEVSTLPTLLSQYELLEDADLKLVERALRQAAVVLSRDKHQLATQLLNCLWVKPSPDIQKLLNQAKEMSPDWHPPR